jgi:hypothetical protein
MQPNTEDAYWAALFLRHACRPNWSFKLMALSSISLNAIAKRLAMTDAMAPDIEVVAMKHQTIMIKAGARLGLPAHEIMV